MRLHGYGRGRSHNRPTVHPVESNQQRWVDLADLSGLHELPFHVVEVGLFVIWQSSDVLVKVLEVLGKDVWRKELLRLDVVLVLHHLLETLLIRLVPPRQLTNTKVAQEEE